MKRIVVYILLSFCISLSHNIKSTDNQHADQTQDILSMVRQEFKKPEYVQDILPNNFSYVIRLLEHGGQTGKPRIYCRSVLKMFGNMLKGTQYVNAYAFSELTEQLPQLLEHYFIPLKSRSFMNNDLVELDMYDRFKEAINNMLYMQFSSRYEFFRQNPEEFFDQLSDQIRDAAEEEVSIEQLRQTLLRFLEIGLGKLIWSPEDNEKIWDSVKTISHHLEGLMEHNVIEDMNDLDDLFWTLIHRFSFFLDITGSTIPPEFYEHIKDDIATQQLLLLELEEQDTCIESKASCLHRSLLHAEAISRAYEQGIITQS